MDKARGKRPLDEDVEVPMNINFDESDVEDDKLTSFIRRSKEEYNSLQKKKGHRVEQRSVREESTGNCVRGWSSIYS
ncbi:hypothetical protein TIFTF001_020407 [Ficus carica]|uniref:Uncharacterized protein n=1 Tax=Ficus carica TaxID=3494 RepID=A0AA88AXW4_FICCA|nr:hypothetical protein TIFTF001_020407 [Ficus carica]